MKAENYLFLPLCWKNTAALKTPTCCCCDFL